MCGGRGGIWLALAAALLHVSLQGEFQRRLYKELVKNYNPLERPVANDSQPLTVYFSLSLLQIMDVSWTDHYLQWNMSEYPGVKNVRFPDGQIWKPDILLYNSETSRLAVRVSPFWMHLRIVCYALLFVWQ
ncbi:cholinergic receptor, nicotinic, alpha polypeptide 7, isoform CRA_d [Rattus norvegicus]|uniref:Cholinergic receptor, nicotinic, alpha polypeptide 7, isoform CRA_d n=1 Tax=Rattus norvegicus TaxID=10116 RepID=A6JBJ7_RAT|nr:cholinergic receptor, nicotinic, alpha polypeptide 7, isoform CRA_d [Rattus norvegicus]